MYVFIIRKFSPTIELEILHRSAAHNLMLDDYHRYLYIYILVRRKHLVKALSTCEVALRSSQRASRHLYSTRFQREAAT